MSEYLLDDGENGDAGDDSKEEDKEGGEEAAA